MNRLVSILGQRTLKASTSLSLMLSDKRAGKMLSPKGRRGSSFVQTDYEAVEPGQ